MLKLNSNLICLFLTCLFVMGFVVGCTAVFLSPEDNSTAQVVFNEGAEVKSPQSMVTGDKTKSPDSTQGE